MNMDPHSAMKSSAAGRASALHDGNISSIADALSNGLEDISSKSLSQLIQPSNMAESVAVAAVPANNFDSSTVGIGIAGPSRIGIAGPSRGDIVGSSGADIAGSSHSRITDQTNGDFVASDDAAEDRQLDIENRSDVCNDGIGSIGSRTSTYNFSLCSSNPISLDTATRKVLEEVLKQIEEEEKCKELQEILLKNV